MAPCKNDQCELSVRRDGINKIVIATQTPLTDAQAEELFWCIGAMQKSGKTLKDLLKRQDSEKERLKKPDCEHANHDGAGCLGYCGCEQDDEPIDACKQCEKYTGNICAEY